MNDLLFAEHMAGSIMFDISIKGGSCGYLPYQGTNLKVSYLIRLFSLIKCITNTDHDLFSGSGRRLIPHHPTACRNLLEIFDDPNGISYTRFYLKYRQAHPLINILNRTFIGYFVKYQSHVSSWGNYKSAEAAEILNAFIKALRTEANSVACKKQIALYEKGEKKNFREARQFLNVIFDAYQKLNLISIDVGYKAKEIGPWSDGMWDNVNTTRRQFRLFLKKVRSKQPKLLGYIWKLEFGEHRLWRWSIVFVFNDSLISSDVELCNAIGNEWKEVTDQDGLFVNFNLLKIKYDKRVITEVDTQDLEARQQVCDYVIEYVLKGCPLANSVNRKNFRTFGKSELPERAKKIKLNVKPLEDAK